MSKFETRNKKDHTGLTFTGVLDTCGKVYNAYGCIVMYRFEDIMYGGIAHHADFQIEKQAIKLGMKPGDYYEFEAIYTEYEYFDYVNNQWLTTYKIHHPRNFRKVLPPNPERIIRIHLNSI